MFRRLLRWTLIAALIAGAVTLVRKFRCWLPAVAPDLPEGYKAHLLEAGAPGEFPDQQGTYEDPGLVIPGGNVPDLPAGMPCPGALVIYSSWIEIVTDCTGYGGPAAGQNAVAATAAAIAHATAARIPCDAGCQRRVVEVWRGWECGNNPLSAVAAVEVELTCAVTA